jgi:hydroxyacylglutathione hydrolase
LTPDPSTFQFGDLQVWTVNSGHPWHENCYVVFDAASGDQLIVDPGGAAPNVIRHVPLKNGPLRVILTHAHFDHMAGAAQICDHFGCRCLVHKSDAKLLAHAPMYAWTFGKERVELPKAVNYIDADTCLEFAGRRVVLYPTPGHSQGSICLGIHPLIFCGDTILFEKIGRTDLPGGDRHKLMTSVEQLLQQVPEDALFLPGHGRPWSVRDARAWWACNPQLRHVGSKES